MGLITKEVEVRINSRNYQHFKSLGYNIPIKKSSDSSHRKQFVYDADKPIMIKVSDLNKGSHAEVEVLCDYCKQTIKSMAYKTYLLLTSKDGKYCCAKCKGAKTKKIFEEKYGCDWSERTEKTKITLMNRYNTDAVWNIPGVKQKVEKTNQQRYGKKYYTQTEEYKIRAMKTNRENLGVDYPTQSKEVQRKIKTSVQLRYGCDHVMQNEEIKNKVMKRWSENSTGACSKQQRYLCNLYNAELNYPINNFLGDMVLTDDMINIEYHGGGHWLSVVLGNITMEEFTLKEIKRNHIIKKQGFKIITIISKTDKLPFDEILFNMLEDAKQYFKKFPNHSWVEFDIDNEIIRNAENKNGIPYFFGELRRIYDNSLISA